MSINPNLRVISGRHTKATYNEQVIPENQGNPHIEALPNRLNQNDLFDKLFSVPAFRGDIKKVDIEDRLALVQQIGKSFWLPLESQFSKYRQLYNMLKIGYQSRNPLSPEYNRQFAVGIEEIFEQGTDEDGKNLAGVCHTAEMYAEIGLSGIGKTIAQKKLLGLFPQVIHHTSYNGKPLKRTQVVWLHVECPSNKSLGALCRNFYREVDKILGTDYYERFGEKAGTIEKLASRMVKVANLINLGVLVIDEINRVHKAHSGGDDRMIEFITELTNTIGIPIIIMGTFKSLYLFNKSLANSRRGIPDSFTENITDRMLEDSNDWEQLIEALWDLQYTLTKTGLTEELKKVMYHHSMGIADITVKLFMHVQCQAILEGGSEVITPRLIHAVANRSLRLLQPLFDRIRRGDTAALVEYEDVKPDWTEFNEYLKDVKHRVYVHGELAEEHERVIQLKEREEILANLIQFASKLVDIEKAELFSRTVYGASNGMGEASSMYKQLTELILKQEHNKSDKKKASVSPLPKLAKTKKENPLLSEKDLRFIVNKGAVQSLSVEESLFKTGVIKLPTEFIGY
ncbi:ATP-binding protein [Paenibacillus roseipurpureus]|uniref:ATP-binding protein n=1 Tax=Paenibacillus roseopurpureus TaxID=2918901 RepID=A0AA96LQ44_9BACL|nr:ATP-binding protein [Paenibacillus sp. MBLB1832]WNR45226.1 ATP-binding protein [Paenibacillus sp. MBLB1832]